MEESAENAAFRERIRKRVAIISQIDKKKKYYKLLQEQIDLIEKQKSVQEEEIKGLMADLEAVSDELLQAEYKALVDTEHTTFYKIKQ